MIGNLICWIIAIGMMLSKTNGTEDLYTRTALAMGFIFLGILSKAVDAYLAVHKRDDNHNTNT